MKKCIDNKLLVLLALILTILTIQLGMRVEHQDFGVATISYGFPATYIIYNYASYVGLSYAPEEITPFVWIRNISILFRRSSIDILGIIVNVVIYYLVLCGVKKLYKRIKKRVNT